METGCLRLEDSKTGSRTVFLNRKARDIVERRMAETSGEFLFRSPNDPARPISDNLPLWYECAGEPESRMFGFTTVVILTPVWPSCKGSPLPVVAQLLGHRAVTMSLNYAHTCDREIEVAAERIGDTVSKRFGLLGDMTKCW